MHQITKIPFGIKIIIGFHLLSAFLWIFGQGGAVISYDTVAKWGFQDPRELIDPIIVEVNRAIGLGDMIIQIPLTHFFGLKKTPCLKNIRLQPFPNINAL